MVDKEEAVWRPYPEYPFVEANQFGEIRTIDRTTTCKNGAKRHYKGRVLKQQKDQDGYLLVGVSVNGRHINLYAHRVIATCFLPNPDNLPQVNHKDCNRTNNNVNNLEWCTNEYNVAYREKYGVSAKEFSKALRKPLFAVNLKTLKVTYFESQNEAARQLGVSGGQIYNVLNGRYRYAGGYWFTEDKSEITEEKIKEIKNNMSKGMFAVNLKTKKISFFVSQREAARQLGVFRENIGKVLKGKRKQTGGYWFCYADENAVEKTRVKFGDEIANKVKELINEKLQ